jgi:hypothetical protein
LAEADENAEIDGDVDGNGGRVATESTLPAESMTGEWGEFLRFDDNMCYGVECLHGLRLMQWNVEWFDTLFATDTMFASGAKAQRLYRIAAVINDIQPDVLTLQEGPLNKARMELFVATFLDNRFLCFGGFDAGNQQCFILVRKNGPLQNPRLHVEADAYLQKQWSMDIQGDCALEQCQVRVGVWFLCGAFFFFFFFFL